VPALIVARQCPVVHLVRGIQRIFLTEDGRKYPRGTVKMSLGSIAGGRAELLWPDAELLLCEGAENALSAWRIFKTPAWAICGGFPAELPLPKRVRSVQIIADHDPHGVSERNAKVLARSIRATGKCFPKERVCYLSDNVGHIYKFAEAGPTWRYLGSIGQESILHGNPSYNYTWVFHVTNDKKKAYIVTNHGHFYDFDLGTGHASFLADLKKMEPELAAKDFLYGHDARGGSFFPPSRTCQPT
jgi:Toprim domain